MEFETALLIIPPAKVQAFAYPIRERYDTESFNRVPAHITLLYPFVPSDQVEAAVEKLQPICSKFPPFDLVLDGYGKFETAIFLEPSNPERMLKLFEQISTAFPEYPIYQGEHGDTLHPHLTLASFDDPTEAGEIELPPTPYFSFTINRLHIYLGSPEASEPYIPTAVIPLGE